MTNPIIFEDYFPTSDKTFPFIPHAHTYDTINFKSALNPISGIAVTDNGGQVYNVKAAAFGAIGDGLHDDTVAIRSAMNTAGPVGGTVFFPPGNYLISSPLLWDKETAGVVTLAPSLIGATDRGGPSTDFADTGSVRLTCSSSFPVGEFVIDYLGPTANQTNITGYTVQGFVIQCKSRGAGIRCFNSENSLWRGIVINDAATPNPANTQGSPLAAVNFLANPSFNATNNYPENIYVNNAAQDGFYFNEGSGSYQIARNCTTFIVGRHSYNVGNLVTMLACNAQQSANTTAGGADFHIQGSCTLIGCVSFNAAPNKGNGLNFAFADNIFCTFQGCTFYGAGGTGQTEANSAVVNFPGNANMLLTFNGCQFKTGAHTSDYIYATSGGSGTANFNGCMFSAAGHALTNTAYNLNSTKLVKLNNCTGINPVGAITVTPSAGAWLNANPIPVDVYVATAGSYTGTTTITSNGGSAVTVPNAVVGATYRIPAYATLTWGVGGTITTDPTFNGFGN